MYEINLSRCIFCGYCEIACPFDAITMGHDYEMSDYTRSDLIFTKEMLLAGAARAHAAAGRRGMRRRSVGVLFFIAAISALIGAIGVVTLRNPLYAVLALVCHLVALAALFLLLRAEFVAAAQVVVYAGAVMVLYVFVVAYVGGGDELAGGWRCGSSGRCSASRSRSSCSSRCSARACRDQGPGRALQGRLRHARAGSASCS